LPELKAALPTTYKLTSAYYTGRGDEMGDITEQAKAAMKKRMQQCDVQAHQRDGKEVISLPIPAITSTIG